MANRANRVNFTANGTEEVRLFSLIGASMTVRRKKLMILLSVGLRQYLQSYSTKAKISLSIMSERAFFKMCRFSCERPVFFLFLKTMAVLRMFTVSPQCSRLPGMSAATAVHRLYGTADSLLQLLSMLFQFSAKIRTLSVFGRLKCCTESESSTHQVKHCQTTLASSSSAIQPFLLFLSFSYRKSKQPYAAVIN